MKDKAKMLDELSAANNAIGEAMRAVTMGDESRLADNLSIAKERIGTVQHAIDLGEYARRAAPRMDAIESLSKKIDFSSSVWHDTPEGSRYRRLMDEQSADEMALGL